MATTIGGIPIVFGDPRQQKALPLSHPKARFGDFGTETTILLKGYTRRRGCLPLPCDILFERDVKVKLRDGVSIYVDVYRPVDEKHPVPALMAWSPYGKRGGKGNQVLDDFPFRMGVPLRGLSELQKFEGPDPGYWVQYGYAIINPDPRGIGKSEGDIYQWGSQEGQDGADVVDWIGTQDWCNGKVGLSGNSYLAISQWFIAAERSKYLAAIAPWEGFSNLYMESTTAGGVLTKQALEFCLRILSVNAGENSWENTVAMAMEHKIFGAYHEDKAAMVQDINVPAYVVASWSNPIHTFGTFRAYQRLQNEKWLRIHDTWEWPDYYNEANRSDLHRFFDHYLKGVPNKWETTPRVRARIMDTANPLPNTGTNMTFAAFPPPNARPVTLYLDGGTRTLTPGYPASTTCHYDAKRTGLAFEYTFPQDTTCCGPVTVQLALSVKGGNDTDIFVTMEKILISGAVGSQLKVPYEYNYQSLLMRAVHKTGLVPMLNFLFYEGPKGRHRLSRSISIEDVEDEETVTVSMRHYRPMGQGEIRVVSVGMTPIGMVFRKGEKVRIRIKGVDETVFPPIDQATLDVRGLEDVNAGVEVELHCGMRDVGMGSFVTLPVVSQ